MTIAIGTLFNNGVIVCADSKVVASDGATTTDSKITLSHGEECGSFLIADSAEDGRAAKMMAMEIRDAIYSSADPKQIAPAIKNVMTNWYGSYGDKRPPDMQFIIARVFPINPRNSARIYRDNCELYFSEPPATVLKTCDAISIGRGSRVVEPLQSVLYGITQHSMDLRMTLLRLAFLMQRAKKEEGSFCGGDTHTIVLTCDGSYDMVAEREMRAAEELAREIEIFLLSTGRMMTTGAEPEVQKKFMAETLNVTYEELANKARSLSFPSLRFLGDSSS